MASSYLNRMTKIEAVLDQLLDVKLMRKTSFKEYTRTGSTLATVASRNPVAQLRYEKRALKKLVARVRKTLGKPLRLEAM